MRVEYVERLKKKKGKKCSRLYGLRQYINISESQGLCPIKSCCCCCTGIRELSIQFCNGRRESHHSCSNSSSNTFGRDCASECEAYFLSFQRKKWVGRWQHQFICIYIYGYVCNTLLQIVERHPLIHPSFNGRCAQLSYPGVFFMYGSSYRSKRNLYIYVSFYFI